MNCLPGHWTPSIPRMHADHCSLAVWRRIVKQRGSAQPDLRRPGRGRGGRGRPWRVPVKEWETGKAAQRKPPCIPRRPSPWVWRKKIHMGVSADEFAHRAKKRVVQPQCIAMGQWARDQGILVENVFLRRWQSHEPGVQASDLAPLVPGPPNILLKHPFSNDGPCSTKEKLWENSNFNFTKFHKFYQISQVLPTNTICLHIYMLLNPDAFVYDARIYVCMIHTSMILDPWPWCIYLWWDSNLFRTNEAILGVGFKMTLMWSISQ